MFKLETKLDILRELCNVADVVVKEVRLKVSKEGIVCKAPEKSKVALLHISYSNKIFENFAGDDSEIAFEIDKFRTVLSLGRANEIVELDFDDKENRLVVKVGDVVRHMTLIDKNAIEERKIPNISPPNWIALKTTDLAQGIKGSSTISETIKCTLTQDKFIMHSEEKGDTIDVTIIKDKWGKSEIKDSESISEYPLKFLEDIIKVIGSNETVVIYLQTNFPLRLEFNLANGAGQGRFYVAPQVIPVDEKKKEEKKE